MRSLIQIAEDVDRLHSEVADISARRSTLRTYGNAIQAEHLHHVYEAMSKLYGAFRELLEAQEIEDENPELFR